mmetsp:Transcript_3759/g.6934  ORF Transcript_3759/g.6934 Transcript_3759/m.6934 type:complete len:419 (-) Transcript_3759:47-1303(-)
MRYGSGVLVEAKSQEKEQHQDEADNSPIPYPVMEFRVANEGFARHSGEIANAKIQVWASISSRKAAQGLREVAKKNATGMSRQQRKRKQQKMNKKGEEEMQEAKKSSSSNSTYQMGNFFKSVGHTMADTATSMGKQVGKTLVGSYHQGNSMAPSLSDISETKSIDDGPSQASGLSLLSKERSSSRMGEVSRDNSQAMQNLLMQSVVLQDLGGKTTPRDRAGNVLDDPQQRTPGVIMMDEGEFSSPTIYSRVELENDSHPFFKRIWTLRHRLNKDSPLLNGEGAMILERFHANGGKGWPPELNSYQKLREIVTFEDISVTLSGTDHTTGNSVYGNTSYTSSDLVVGYRFANALMKSERTGEVGVDLLLVNDVLEQHGGGGEPLVEEEKLYPPLTMVEICGDIENQMFPLENESDETKEE